jgi:feruloyl esterase
MASAVAAVALVSAAPAARAAVVSPTRACSALASVDLSRLDAQLLSVHRQRRSGRAYCAVDGIITPQTHFEVLLPLRTWRGDYLQQGCGGFCGIAGGSQSASLTDPSRTSLSQGPWRPLLRGRLVVAGDDQGHRAPTNADALWAKNDPQLRVVYGYTSEHSMARVAKALIRAFYGRGPAYSYFDGVSDGGHEALNEAQRYPGDFDGILVGAPANNLSALFGIDETWQARVNVDARGRQILPAEKLPALHAAVLRACADARGVIRDPRRCTFDPARLACAPGVDTATCLTPAQVEMVRREYRGPTDRRGRNLYNGGEPYGSELSWSGWLAMPAADAKAPADTAAAGLGLNYLRYAAYWRNPPSTFGLADFPFTHRAAVRLRPLGRIYNATDPDLSAFRARGGKLIIYHGWADQAIPPQTSLDYYGAVIRHMGGYAMTSRFARLYMIPGLYHCDCGDYGTGSPATRPQFMGQLTRWVETGKAPGSVRLPVVRRVRGGPHRLTVRPFNPLVGIPRNRGLNSNYDYVDKAWTYRPHNQLWCRQRGKRLVCSSRRG